MSLHRMRFVPALLTLVGLAACGGLLAPTESGVADDGASPAQVAEPAPREAGVRTPDAPPEPPSGPCHLVAAGEPFRGLAFEDESQSFDASGLLARRAGNRIVQYGAGLGIRTGTWQDPPIFAAEYDVSTWPPTAVHAPTELFHSMHPPANLTELPDGSLALSWWFDNDSPLGERGVRFRTVEATSWALQPDRFLMQDVTTWSRPQLTADAASLAMVYRRQTVSEDGMRFVYHDEVSLFGLDGGLLRTVPLWSFEDLEKAPTTSLLRVADGLLLAASFGECAEIPADRCSAGGVAVYRVEEAGVRRVHEEAAAGPRRSAAAAKLVGDGASHTWLTWWDVDARTQDDSPTATHLLARPLAAEGTPTGAVESWLTDDHTASVPRQGASAGAVGLVFPLTRTAPQGEAWTHELHLLHRQLEQDEPVETLRVPIEALGSVETVQLDSPRALLVGYSISDPQRDARHGEIRKYVCREDAR